MKIIYSVEDRSSNSIHYFDELENAIDFCRDDPEGEFVYSYNVLGEYTLDEQDNLELIECVYCKATEDKLFEYMV